MTVREKTLTLGLVALAAALAIYAVLVKPAVERVETLRRVVPEKQNALLELKAKSAEYSALRSQLDSLESLATDGDDGFSLLPYVESVTAGCQLRDRVASMQQRTNPISQVYSASTVSLELADISLRQLVEFLDRVGSEQRARIVALAIQRDVQTSGLLDSSIEISSLLLNKAR